MPGSGVRTGSRPCTSPLGTLLRDLHRATAMFRPPAGAVWFPWHGRDLGGPDKVIGHCDAAITPETTAHPVALWAMAWRARSAAWMIRHRRILEAALAR